MLTFPGNERLRFFPHTGNGARADEEQIQRGLGPCSGLISDEHQGEFEEQVEGVQVKTGDVDGQTRATKSGRHSFSSSVSESWISLLNVF